MIEVNDAIDVMIVVIKTLFQNHSFNHSHAHSNNVIRIKSYLITKYTFFSEKIKLNYNLRICNHLICMETVCPEKKTVKITTKYYVHPLFQNYAASKSGEIINTKTKRELKPGINCKSGHCQVYIYDGKFTDLFGSVLMV